MFEEIINYIITHRDEYFNAVTRHILLSITALSAATIISIPVGILCAKKQHISNALISILTVFKIIPSVGLLILILPFVKTGFISTCFALSILALPTLSIHTYCGFTQISPFIIESAQGIGLSPSQIFFRIELPLALAQILTGLRSATIDIISNATIASMMGAGGLGQYVFAGMQINDYTLLLIGGISVAVIALSNEIVLHYIQKKVIDDRMKS